MTTFEERSVAPTIQGPCGSKRDYKKHWLETTMKIDNIIKFRDESLIFFTIEGFQSYFNEVREVFETINTLFWVDYTNMQSLLENDKILKDRLDRLDKVQTLFSQDDRVKLKIYIQVIRDITSCLFTYFANNKEWQV